MSPREIRKRAGRSLDWAAAMASVTAHTARIYELDPAAVLDTKKRAALDRVYAQLATEGLVTEGGGSDPP